jgi:hypothetical protein
MKLTTRLLTSIASLALAFSPIFAQAQDPSAASLSGSGVTATVTPVNPAPTDTSAPAGSQVATDSGTGGLSKEAVVGIVVVLAAGAAIAASGGGSDSGTTGTTGTR